MIKEEEKIFIHPSMENLRISKKSKIHLSKLGLYKFFENNMDIYDPSNTDLNHWEENCSRFFSIDPYDCSPSDTKVFVRAIVTFCKQLVKKNATKEKVLFYICYCGGGLFNFFLSKCPKNVDPEGQITSNFGRPVNFISIDDLMKKFAKDQCWFLLRDQDINPLDMIEPVEYDPDVWYTAL